MTTSTEKFPLNEAGSRSMMPRRKGRPLSYHTLVSWVKDGRMLKRGGAERVYLHAEKIAGIWYTTDKDLADFIDRFNADNGAGKGLAHAS